MWQNDWRNREIPEAEWPVVNKNPNWKVVKLTRDSALNNRPGQKKIRVWVYDKQGKLMPGIKVRMDVEPTDTGTAHDHMNVWQYTGGAKGREGYWEWEHLGIPTRYVLWMEDDEKPLIERIRTDLSYEYPTDEWGNYTSWRPVNKPGVYSFRVEIHQI